jgi:hypothetical protein
LLEYLSLKFLKVMKFPLEGKEIEGPHRNLSLEASVHPDFDGNETVFKAFPAPQSAAGVGVAIKRTQGKSGVSRVSAGAQMG